MPPRSAEVAGWFKEFEHTGDMGIELSAPSRTELFRRAAVVLAYILVEIDGIVPAERREITVSAATDADLMHDLLSELLALFGADGFIWSDAAVEERDGSLVARLSGERFDESRHEFHGEIKAVTYHQLVVDESPQGWRARVIFDV